MAWENYGPVWHIGHELPLAVFSFESIHDQQFQVAFDLRNFRPEWQYENVSKGAKVLVDGKGTAVELAKKILSIQAQRERNGVPV